METKDIEKRLSELEAINKKKTIHQNKLLWPFGIIFLFMIIFISSGFLNNKVGSFVKENNITQERGTINTTSRLIPIKYDEKGNPIEFLRDSTHIYYGFFILLSIILLIIAFDNKRYEDVEDE